MCVGADLKSTAIPMLEWLKAPVLKSGNYCLSSVFCSLNIPLPLEIKHSDGKQPKCLRNPGRNFGRNLLGEPPAGSSEASAEFTSGGYAPRDSRP